ncbi:MAG TPA: helix-turn-helix domain-containing protein [Candidatus Angelobacter sp.]|nr:helix-turn-helix domain-containing protein [Candidatus Angelobacter sp.]
MLGAKIKKLRESKGLSLSECAERASVAKSYLSTIERGLRSNPSIQFIEKIADVLNVSVTSLINDETTLEETLAKANQELDKDWLDLVKEAMDSGIEKNEFKEFLEYQKWRKDQS